MREIRIVFMGTPEFAVAPLKALLEAKYNVVAVVTAVDKPAGRGRKLKQSAVKEFALANSLPVLQPTNLKNDNFLNELHKLNPTLQIVVAFRMLPEAVWKFPIYGTFNLHASLLPNYRGAAPINWAIINGETKTGVTTFFIDDKIDTGNIIKSKAVPIQEETTLGELHDTLMKFGSKLVVETVEIIAENSIKTSKQPVENIKPAPKIFTETCKIEWNKNITDIYNLIRGLNPFPGGWTNLKNGNDKLVVKIYDVKKELAEHTLPNGLIISSKNELKIAVKNGFIVIESLQLSGKKKMETKSLLNGYSFLKDAIMH